MCYCCCCCCSQDTKRKTWENRICLCTKGRARPSGLYSEKNKMERVRGNFFLTKKRWKENSSDIKPWPSLPAS